MPGGLHAPLEQWLEWPAPNYIDPSTKPKYVLIAACVFGPISLASFLMRLWVRIQIQRNPGWDDWLMLAAWLPVMSLTVLYPLVIERYYFNRHLWDVPLTHTTLQRKYVMAIYIVFAIGSGLIKTSILLFYRRISSRAVSPAFRWALWTSIGFICVTTAIFVFLTIFSCNPVSAFWDQENFLLVLSGTYKYKCLDEGAEIVSNGAMSAIQDLIAATLPAALCWKLKMSSQQKIALYFVFAVSYLAVALGAMRTYSSYRLFFETYDVTWVAGDIWLWSLLELHIGCMCANAPAVKVFYRHYFQVSEGTYADGSHARTATSSNQSVWGKISFWRKMTSHRNSGYLSGSHIAEEGVIVAQEQHGTDVEMGHVHAITKN